MRLKAIASPDEWMTMIMDGSDQDVSVLPSIRVSVDPVIDKSSLIVIRLFSGEYEEVGKYQRKVEHKEHRQNEVFIFAVDHNDTVRPSIKLVAVKCHGRQNFVFGVPPDQRHGSSMTCSIINKVLNARSPGDKARKLWIQLDNTSGENKNNFVMGYLGTLVLTGAFDEVRVKLNWVSY